MSSGGPLLRMALLHPFHGWVVSHCVYVPQLLYPFICLWTSGLFPCPVCSEHWGALNAAFLVLFPCCDSIWNAGVSRGNPRILFSILDQLLWGSGHRCSSWLPFSVILAVPSPLSFLGSWFLNAKCFIFSFSSLICQKLTPYSSFQRKHKGPVASRTRHGTTEWFHIRKRVCEGCISSSSLFSLFYLFDIIRNARLDEA